MAREGLTDLQARKRRILEGAVMANAALPATQRTLADAGTIQRVSKGSPLVRQGEPATAIAMLGMGRVRLTRALSDARTLPIGYRCAGDLVGEAALGGVIIHRESAIATEDVEALLVPVSTVRALVSADQAFGSGLLATLVKRQGDAEDRLASIHFRNVEARLAEFLVKAVERWGILKPRGVLIAASFTHEEMASMIGATRETVTLTLGDLRRNGVIEIDRRRIVVLDKEALESRI